MDNTIRSPEELGQVIRRYRKSLDLSQEDLSDMTSHKQSTISELENGKSGVKIQTIFNILSALKLELELSPRDKDASDIEDVF